MTTIERDGGSIGSQRTAGSELVVKRGVNPDRFNVLAVIIGAMLGVGMAMGLTYGPLWGVASFVATAPAVFGLLAFVCKVGPVRHATMSAMDWVTRA